MSLLKGEIGTQTYSQERAQCGDEGRDEALLPHVKHTRDHQQTARSQGTGREQTEREREERREQNSGA